MASAGAVLCMPSHDGLRFSEGIDSTESPVATVPQMAKSAKRQNVFARVLRIILLLLALDAGIKGFLLIFGGKWVILRSSPNLPASEITTLLLLTRLESGALDLGLSAMLFLAFRNPRGNRAVIVVVASLHGQASSSCCPSLADASERGVVRPIASGA